MIGSDRLCQNLTILLGDYDTDLEILYNDLISGQLVEENEYNKLKDIEDYVLRLSSLHHNLCTSH